MLVVTVRCLAELGFDANLGTGFYSDRKFAFPLRRTCLNFSPLLSKSRLLARHRFSGAIMAALR